MSWHWSCAVTSVARTTPPPPTAPHVRPLVCRRGDLPLRDRRPRRARPVATVAHAGHVRRCITAHSPTLVPGQQSDTRCTRRSKPRAPVVAEDRFDERRARARHKTVGRRATVRATDAFGWLWRQIWSAKDGGYGGATTADWYDRRPSHASRGYFRGSPKSRSVAGAERPQRNYIVSAAAPAAVMVLALPRGTSRWRSRRLESRAAAYFQLRGGAFRPLTSGSYVGARKGGC